MPDAQIPVMLLTPSNSCMSIEKLKVKSHPNWNPYAFDTLELSISKESEDKNEYATYRKLLIEKEKQFVQEYIKKTKGKEEVKQEETKDTQHGDINQS